MKLTFEEISPGFIRVETPDKTLVGFLTEQPEGELHLTVAGSKVLVTSTPTYEADVRHWVHRNQRKPK